MSSSLKEKNIVYSFLNKVGYVADIYKLNSKAPSSAIEERRLAELQLLEKSKEITGLLHQVKIKIYNENDFLILTYSPDFLYRKKDGTLILEETKSTPPSKMIQRVASRYYFSKRIMIAVQGMFPEINLFILFVHDKYREESFLMKDHMPKTPRKVKAKILDRRVLGATNNPDSCICPYSNSQDSTLQDREDDQLLSAE